MLDNEDNLIKRAQKGEIECFGHLYDYYLSKIYRYIFLKVSNRQEAEDLTHDVFVSAWENINGYKFKGHPFSSWLYNIARNKVIDYYRTRKIQLSIEASDPDLFKAAETVQYEADLRCNLNLVMKAMKQLSGEYQDVLIMRFIEDLSPKEIAGVLNKSEGAVRLIQHRAIRDLKDLLEQSEQSDN